MSDIKGFGFYQLTLLITIVSMNRRRYLIFGSTAIATGLAGCQFGDSNTSQTNNEGPEDGSNKNNSPDSSKPINAQEIFAPESVQVDEEFTTKLTLVNNGDQEKTYTGTLAVSGEEISTEEDVEATLSSGETKEVEVLVLRPECEGMITIELVDEAISRRVEVTNYPTPRSDVEDHRYSEGNDGVAEYPGPSSPPAKEQEYENALSATVRINENLLATFGKTGVRVMGPDGEERWSDELQAANSNLALFEGRLYLVDKNDLLCYDVETGEVLWEFTEAGPPSDEVFYTEMYGTPLLSDGAVYFNGMHGQVWAVNAISGCKQWNTSLTPDGENHGISGIPAIKNDTLYIVGDDGIGRSRKGPLCALNKETGEIQWKTDEQNIIGETTPVKGSHVYVRTHERDGLSSTETVRAYDIETGSTDWETELNNLSTSVVVDSDRVYVGRSWPTANSNGELVALNRSNGDVEWRTEPDAGIVDAPVVGTNSLFVTDWEDNLYSIAPGSGDVNWEAADLVRHSTPIIHEDRLYLISSQSNHLTAFA